MTDATFNNSGNIAGPVVQGGTVTNTGQIATVINNAGQMAGGLAAADPADRAALQDSLARLEAALKAAPPAHAEDAEAAASTAHDLVAEAAKEAPNKSRLRGFGTMLLGAVKGLGLGLDDAEKIVGLIGKIHGLG